MTWNGASTPGFPSAQQPRAGAKSLRILRIRYLGSEGRDSDPRRRSNLKSLERRAPENGAGGQPRHQIDWSALVYTDGLGAGLNGSWRSATSVAGRDAIAPDTLRFSALDTVNLMLLVDLSRLPATRGQPWAHGMRVAFLVLNLFDRRQSVQDSAGMTPLAFRAGLSRSHRPHRLTHRPQILPIAAKISTSSSACARAGYATFGAWAQATRKK